MTLESQLAELRVPLLRYATLQLRDAAAAEDAVSDTLLAILEKPDAFAGASSLRTYATGILKHKLVDTLRRMGRETAIEVPEDRTLDDMIDQLFQADGHWVEPPRPWGQPEAVLSERQFFTVLEGCIEGMPARLARVFMAREWLEKEVTEICAEMQITANHCGVLLYRARMLLRECMDQRWVRPQP